MTGSRPTVGRPVETCFSTSTSCTAPREHFERPFCPRPSIPRTTIIGSRRRSSWRWTSEAWAATRFASPGGSATELELECGRCLEPFGCRSTRRSSCATCRRRANGGEGRARGRRRRPGDRVLPRRHAGRDRPAARAVQLALPMKPLCAEACRGLCPQCGANLNRPQCGCAPMGRSQARAAQGAADDETRRIDDAQSKTPALEDAGPPSAAPTTP